MAKLRKVVFFDESVDFLKDLNRGGVLVNLVMKQVFSGSRTENIELAMDLIHGRKKLEVHVIDRGKESAKKPSEPVRDKPSKIKVKIKEGQEKTIGSREKNIGSKEIGRNKGKRLLNDLSRIARDFGE